MGLVARGQALAESFWAGYLKDVACGDVTVAERFAAANLQQSPALDGCRLVEGKLFILEPRDGNVDLQPQPGADGLRPSDARVPGIVLNRAGVVGRTMGTHTIYTFGHPEFGTVAVAMEFATPIRTMRLVLEECPHTGLYELPPNVDCFHSTLEDLKKDKVGGGDVVLILGDTQDDTVRLLQAAAVAVLQAEEVVI